MHRGFQNEDNIEPLWQLKHLTSLLHNSAQDFLKNNRGIDDGSDLPEEYMSNLYDRIINDEIKMKVGASGMQVSGSRAALSCELHFR